MLRLIKRYSIVIIPILLLCLYKEEKPKKTSEIIEKTTALIKNAHLYSNIVDGKKIEIFVEKGEHNDKVILVSGVEGTISDLNDNSLLKIRTSSGEFNMQDKILKINKEVKIIAYKDINREIKITSQDIEFNTRKKMIKFKSDLFLENDKFSIMAKSGEYDMNSMTVKLDKLTIKQK